MTTLHLRHLARVLVVTPFIASPLLAQTVLRVDVDAAPGGDGSSWAAAFDDLVDALDAAAITPGATELWVAEGIYVPDNGTGDVTRSFDVTDDVHLLGGFSGDELSADERDPLANGTVLSGDLLGDDVSRWINRSDNALQVVRATALAVGCSIDGFTISGGNADFDGGDLLGGGGVFIENAELDVRRCLFEENTAGSMIPTLGNFGAAIYLKGSGSLTVDDCRFERNRANSGGAIGTFDDGGTQTVTITNSDFGDNFVPTQSAGAIRAIGCRSLVIVGSSFVDHHAGYAGAIHTTLVDELVLRDSSFERNFVDVKSAALWIDRSDNGDLTPAVIERCAFIDNATDGGFRGGTIALEETITSMTDCEFRGNVNVRVNPVTSAIEGSATVKVEFEVGHEFRNCLFVDNFAGFIGGVELEQAEATFTNCGFVNNRSASAFVAASGIAAGASAIDVHNTIFWNNRVGVGVDDDLPGTGGERAQLTLHSGAVVTIGHSLVEGWSGSFGGVGNSGADPLFVNELAGNLRLTDDSPAVDAGSNDVVPADLANDLDGNARIVDGDGDSFAVVDIGPYEFDGTIVATDSAAGRDEVSSLQVASVHGTRVPIRIRLSDSADVDLSVFDVRGRRVRALVDGHQPAGEHTIEWDGRNSGGRQVAAGAYFVRLRAEGRVYHRRVIVAR